MKNMPCFLLLFSILIWPGYAAAQPKEAQARNILQEFWEGIDWDGEGPRQSKKERDASVNSREKNAAAEAVSPARTCSITVYAHKEKGVVNRLVFGNNLLSYDPYEEGFAPVPFAGFKHFGGGIWDPRTQGPVEELLDMAREAGVSILRYPGGCGSHSFDWKKTVGQRQDFLFGLDEFLQTAGAVDAQAVITISYFTGDETDAADLVEYLNHSDDGTNPNGGVDWAARRRANGHPAPYGVEYFEIGNEVYHGDHHKIKHVDGASYARRYLQYYDRMKAVDPSIKIGMITDTIGWTQEAASLIGRKVDFAVFHTYPSTESDEKALAKTTDQEIFEAAFTRPYALDMPYLEELRDLLRRRAGKIVPVAVTEFNTGFTQKARVPYNYTLGSALVNAQLIQYFLEPSSHVLLANFWNFTNEYFSMLQSRTDYMAEDYRRRLDYVKRPVFYVFQMYREHFGEQLVTAEVETPEFVISQKNFEPFQRLAGAYFGRKDISVPAVGYLSAIASKNKKGDKLYLMVINRDAQRSHTTVITFADAVPGSEAAAWILTGPSMIAVNEQDQRVAIKEEMPVPVSGMNFVYTFEPHSLTAVEIPLRQEISGQP